jgi:hypothetical protein
VERVSERVWGPSTGRAQKPYGHILRRLRLPVEPMLEGDHQRALGLCKRGHEKVVGWCPLRPFPADVQEDRSAVAAPVLVVDVEPLAPLLRGVAVAEGPSAVLEMVQDGGVLCGVGCVRG